MTEFDPFQKYATLGAGGVPAAPPEPQSVSLPTRVEVDGIILTADRLTALDRIARRHRAHQTGLVDRLDETRGTRDDARARSSILHRKLETSPHRDPAALAHLAEIESEANAAGLLVAEIEVELADAADAASTARANLSAAMTFARDHGLCIPAGLTTEGR